MGAQVVEGRVLDSANGRPTSGVTVQLTDLQGDVLVGTETDPRGAFTLVAPEPGEFLVIASALGYRTVRGGVFVVGPGGRIEIDIRLQVVQGDSGMDGTAVTPEADVRQPPYPASLTHAPVAASSRSTSLASL